MRIRTLAFLLGLLPTLLVAIVLTAYQLHTRLADLDSTVTQQGMAIARHLASSAEYGVVSGNTAVLDRLLDQTLAEPGVVTAAVVWPNATKRLRGEPVERLPPLDSTGTWQDGRRAWFSHPVRLTPLYESDYFIEEQPADDKPLAWIVVSLNLDQKHGLAQKLLLGSLGISLLGLLLALVVIQKLASASVSPLLDIIATVKDISSGSFGTRMALTARSPELRELQSMVNQMSESLNSYQKDMEASVLAVTAELDQKKREAEQANLAKSRFLAAASHDLRQPMHAISLYVESLKPQMQGRAAEDTLNKVERSILATVELFNAILDVSRLDAGVIQPSLGPVRIRKLLLHLAEEFAVEADSKGLSLRVRAPDVLVESDEVLLERILRNLLSNALQHTTRGGVLLTARRYRGRLRLQIWDTGSGIAREHQQRIFDEFYQAGSQDGPTRRGLGLGLAIVRRLVQLLDCPLQLKSRPGRGTVFSLDVPLLTNGPVVDADSPVDASVLLEGRALVVDDDAAIRDALDRLLRKWGLEVDAVSTLRKVGHASQAAPDLVLADYQLCDGETGLMVAKAARERWGAQLPIVLITGDTRAETMQTLRDSGFPILHKPVSATALHALLVRLLQGRPA